ncbi:hypothetical protein L1987_79937 [Smallanthus sonchifolius]|uniref:Uncharacterized protein n=1 Tax=Smallanthus sonchifolius TaxID=185202 RepID=A0ACB8YLG6_9ASTR|nr:hypothetical protein L1987_79937 [Smallanthus sonchifolius]
MDHLPEKMKQIGFMNLEVSFPFRFGFYIPTARPLEFEVSLGEINEDPCKVISFDPTICSAFIEEYQVLC